VLPDDPRAGSGAGRLGRWLPAWPLAAYAGLYAGCLLLLVRREGVDPAEPLFVLATIGIGFSALAWWATRGLTPRECRVRFPRREGLAILAYLVVLTVFITWGLPAVRTLASPGWPAEILVLGAKLAVFVVVPIGLWRLLFGYSMSDLFAFRAGLAGHWRPALVLAAAAVLFQALLGRARTELPALHLNGPVLLAFLGGFVWLLLDVGLVEELPFRGFLQTRLAAWARSEVFGLAAMAVLFGLAHAPGLFLRPILTGEAVGTHPTLVLAVGYSIVYTSVSGFFLGVLWLRTRNPWVVVFVHAAVDWMPTALAAVRSGFPGA